MLFLLFKLKFRIKTFTTIQRQVLISTSRFLPKGSALTSLIALSLAIKSMLVVPSASTPGSVDGMTSFAVRWNPIIHLGPVV